MVKVPGTMSRMFPPEHTIVTANFVTFNGDDVDSSESDDSEVPYPPIPIRFENTAEYAKYFGAAIKLESDFRKYLVESTHLKVNTPVRWKNLPNGKVLANFSIEYDEAVWKLHLGEKLRLRRGIGNAINWEGVGRVVKDNEEVVLEMETSAHIPRDQTTGFFVTPVWISTSYDRMVEAIKKLTSESSNNQYLCEQILGNSAENTVSGLIKRNKFQHVLSLIPSLPPLSAPQETIMRKAMQHRLTLIQGPSATGKTVTLLGIVYNLALDIKGPILVCAPTNAAVDQLASSIQRMKLSVTRLFAETRPSDGKLSNFPSSENQIRERMSPEIKKLQKCYDEGEKLSSKHQKELQEWRKITERAVLDYASVICCTCISAGDERLSSMKFYAILIDESMQATEPECLIPISLGCECLVLVGDFLQLNPVIKSKKALEWKLNRSLFQRLVDIGVQPLNLTVQYRMHPKLWHFPSTHYEGSLSNGVIAAQRKLPDHVFPWPVPDFPLMFYDVRSAEKRMYPVESYINRAEASKVEEIVTRLMKRGISPDRIGVITQYVGQKKYLMQHMVEHGILDTDKYRKIDVDMVDAFQGREKDIIIVSCVRSEGTSGVGSLSYIRRFHLILTRAKFGLIIVGNPIALTKHQMWKDFLDFCQQHAVLVKGELGKLVPSKVTSS